MPKKQRKRMKKYNVGGLLKGPSHEEGGIPILAEGRYWERHQVKTAFDLGAYSVVVGSAITRPHLITERLRGIF